ncbi:MAG: anti-sigma factor [Chloroflexota bacterium]|nr:anti-sigma factor [Chloroflexota bacterium]
MTHADTPESLVMSCAEADELAGLYVLDALEAAESEAVRAHLRDCDQAHQEFAELGGVVPALAELFEPVDAPAALKSRVMAAVAAAGVPHAAAGVPAALPSSSPAVPAATPSQAEMDARLWEPPAIEGPQSQPRRQSSLGWGMAAAAVMVIAVLGAWNVVLQSRAGEVEQRAQMVARAIAASTDPDAEVAVLRGTGPAQGASGFAAFPSDGDGYIVLVDLPAAPAGQTYQAWHLVDGQASSAGLLTVGSDGYAVLSGVDSREDAQQIALTIEPAGGVDTPSTDPIVAGEISA